MSYEDLLIEAEKRGLTVKEMSLLSSDGRCKGKRIAIRNDIPTTAKKADVLAEELGHYYTSVGRILEQDSTDALKQEHRARLWAFNKRIGLTGLIGAYKHHCQNLYEMADYLGVSEDTLKEALAYYKTIYGVRVNVDRYIIQFEPYLNIYEIVML